MDEFYIKGAKNALRDKVRKAFGLERVNGNDNFPVCAAASTHTFLHCFEHIGSKVARPTLCTYPRRDIFNQHILPLDFASQGHALFDDISAAVFTGFALPEVWSFHRFKVCLGKQESPRLCF